MTGAVRRIIETDESDNDEMGQGLLQFLMIELLRPLLAGFLRTQYESRGQSVPLVGADTYFYFVKGDPKQRLAPDVYVLPGVKPTEAPSSWSLWTLNHPPSFALEIVGTHPAKDYDTIPSVYDQIGTRELIVFDPSVSPSVKALPRAGAKRVRARWQVWRRSDDAAFSLVERSSSDRVRSTELGCWLRVLGEDSERRLRIATDSSGNTLLPTDQEMASLERAEKERERAEKERERAEKERERAEKERERAGKERELRARLKAEEKVRALEAQLAKRSTPKRSQAPKRK